MCYASLQTRAIKSQLGHFQFSVLVKIQGDLLERVVYPLQGIYFLRAGEGGADFELLEGQFGLVPAWVKSDRDPKKFGRHCYNARSESVFEKPSFKRAILHQRAIIPVTEYYEVADLGELKGKRFKVFRPDHAPLLLAALWEHNEPHKLDSCTII